MADDYRRPTPRWCQETAIRLLKISTGELLAHPKILPDGGSRTLLEAAALLDHLGQLIEQQQARRKGGRAAPKQ